MRPSRTISARQARAYVRQLVAGFRAKGLRRGDVVCISGFNNVREKYSEARWKGLANLCVRSGILCWHWELLGQAVFTPELILATLNMNSRTNFSDRRPSLSSRSLTSSRTSVGRRNRRFLSQFLYLLPIWPAGH